MYFAGIVFWYLHDLVYTRFSRNWPFADILHDLVYNKFSGTDTVEFNLAVADYVEWFPFKYLGCIKL